MSYAIARILFASASLILTGTLAVASASAEPAVRQVSVGYADLNLASDAGRATLDRRLHAAVETVCPEIGSRFDTMTCRATALAKARAELQRVAPAAS